MSPAVSPAPFELAELACAMRDDWTRDDVDGAIQAAGLALADRDKTWAWNRVARELVLLAGDLGAAPRDLIEAVRPAIGQRPGLSPAANSDRAAEARQMLDEALAARDETGDAA